MGSIDIDKTDECIKYFESIIKDEPVEHAIVIDKQGNVLHFIGNASNVNIYDFDADGAHITHNHPLANVTLSFGEDDFYFLQANQNIASFRCVNAKYTYSIELLKSLDDVSYSEVYLEAMKSIDQNDDNIDLQDIAMQILDARGYIRYEKR